MSHCEACLRSNCDCSVESSLILTQFWHHISFVDPVIFTLSRSFYILKSLVMNKPFLSSLLSYLLCLGSTFGQMDAAGTRNTDIPGRSSHTNHSPQNVSVNALDHSHRSIRLVSPGGISKNVSRQLMINAGTRLASDAGCSDTSSNIYFSKDSQGIFSGSLAKTSDGNIVIPGSIEDRRGNPFITNPFLIKFTSEGDTIWSRKFIGGYKGRQFYLYKALELSNKDLLVIGNMSLIVPHNGTSDVFVARLTHDGQHIWSHTYRYLRWRDTTSGDFIWNDISESPAGDVYLTGTSHDGTPGAGALIMKISAAGALQWSTDVVTGSYPTGLSATFAGAEVHFFGLTSRGSSIYDAVKPVIVARLNAATGDTVSVKCWAVPNTSRSYFQTPSSGLGLVKLNNGNIMLYGSTSGDSYFPPGPMNTPHHAMLEFDQNLRGLGGYLFSSDITSNSDNSKLTVFPDGNAAFSRLHYISGYTSNMLFGKFENGQIVKERIIPYRGISTTWTSHYVQTPGNGTLISLQNYDSAKKQSRIGLLKLHNSDTSSECVGIDTVISRVSKLPNLREIPAYVEMVFRNQVVETHRNFVGIVDDSIVITRVCKIKNICDSLSVTTANPTICITDDLILSFYKNKECGSRITWNVDTTVVESFIYLNDSTAKLHFKKAWQGFIAGIINGCTLLTDSVYIRVLLSPPTLELGVDQELCPGNTLRISAGSGYASYEWQDGSSDSIYNVSRPGTYYVKTLDACGGVFLDTITIHAGLPVSIDIGADLIACKDDTVHITAPTGFVSYKWFPDHQISSDTMRSVAIYAKTDTAYYIKAEKTRGCFGFDTLNITVKQSLPINLGADTSFCEGDSLLLFAGIGFDRYTWNTGSQASEITVHHRGIYSLKATDHNGCSSYDTLKILDVWNLPKPDLYRDSTMCVGTTVVLSPGNFRSYLWHDGSRVSTRNITTPGTFSVLVEDDKGCKGSDTATITKLLPLPSQFLTNDTSFCTYAEFELKASSSFKDYQWSNGVRQSRITIKQPGRYWLKVTNHNGCIGTDTITITQKDCLQGFYIPSAFTPDGDQRNDDFKPLLFGKVISYQFTIYNRWGGTVFISTKVGEGWNGTVRGIFQNTGTYVWTCAYQLEGESPQVRKGSCMLIR